MNGAATRSTGWGNRSRGRGAIPALLAAVSLSLLWAGTARAQIELNAQEEQLAGFLLGSANQEREVFELDPILCAVARAKAKDMGARRYYGHVTPEGFGANYLVEAAGYPLPDNWGDDLDANNVESIAAGYETPTSVWNAWMNSAPHRVHLLGQNDFFRSHDRVGIGFASVPGSPYVEYWVVITAPAPVDPRLKIDSPAAGAELLSGSVTVSGTAAGDVPAAEIEGRVENGEGIGPWQPAEAGASWQVLLDGLVPGDNLIRVRSLDASGGVIAEVTRPVWFKMLAPLEVAVEGEGTVTAGFEGVSERELAREYEIEATPDAGMIFLGWEGGASPSGDRVLRFRMAEGLRLVAKFAPDPVRLAAGTHFGYLLVDGAPALVTVTVSSRGVIFVAVDGKGWRGRARVYLKGAGEKILALGGRSLRVTLDAAGGFDVGLAEGGAAPAGLEHLAFDAKTAPNPFAGSYTVALAEVGLLGKGPDGDGFLLVQADVAGRVRVTGATGDGTPVSGRGYLGGDGVLRFGANFSFGKGSLFGEVDLAAARQPGGGTGSFTWTIASAGAVIELAAAASDFDKADPTPFGWESGLARFAGGNLASPIEAPVAVSGTTIKGIAPDGCRVSANMNRGTGLVTGSVSGPNCPGGLRSRGVVLQRIETVTGFFGGKLGPGLMEIGETPAL
jgi:hypothetical protein